MAYGKRRFRRRRFKKKGYGLAKRVKKLEIIRKITTELKFIDISASVPVQADYNGVLYQNIAGIVQGTSDVARIGDRIFMKSIEVRCNYTNNSVFGYIVRTLIVLDTESHGTLATVGGILGAIGSRLSTMSFPDRNTRYRFRILADHTTVMNPSIAYNSGTPELVGNFTTAHWHKFLKLNRSCEFIANNGDYTDIGKNNIYLVFISNTTNALGAPYVDFESRIRFTDC